MPDGFNELAIASIPDSITVVLFVEKQYIRAASELKIYEIGNAKAPSTSRVTLTGKITNIKNGEPSPGISLLVENPMFGTNTDLYGFYSIQLQAGQVEHLTDNKNPSFLQLFSIFSTISVQVFLQKQTI